MLFESMAVGLSSQPLMFVSFFRLQSPVREAERSIQTKGSKTKDPSQHQGLHSNPDQENTEARCGLLLSSLSCSFELELSFVESLARGKRVSKTCNTLNFFCTGHKLLLGKSWFSGIGPGHIKPSEFPSL